MPLVDYYGRTLFGNDATDVYAHSLAPNENYLENHEAYADLYNLQRGKYISHHHIFPVTFVTVVKVILNLKKC